MLNVAVNSYGHAGTVSLSNHSDIQHFKGMLLVLSADNMCKQFETVLQTAGLI